MQLLPEWDLDVLKVVGVIGTIGTAVGLDCALMKLEDELDEIELAPLQYPPSFVFHSLASVNVT